MSRPSLEEILTKIRAAGESADAMDGDRDYTVIMGAFTDQSDSGMSSAAIDWGKDQLVVGFSPAFLSGVKELSTYLIREPGLNVGLGPHAFRSACFFRLAPVAEGVEGEVDAIGHGHAFAMKLKDYLEDPAFADAEPMVRVYGNSVKFEIESGGNYAELFLDLDELMELCEASRKMPSDFETTKQLFRAEPSDYLHAWNGPRP